MFLSSFFRGLVQVVREVRRCITQHKLAEMDLKRSSFISSCPEPTTPCVDGDDFVSARPLTGFLRGDGGKDVAALVRCSAPTQPHPQDPKGRARGVTPCRRR